MKMPTVAFDFHETLWAECSCPKRAELIRALYIALHKAGWRVIIVSWSASPQDDRARDRKWRLETFDGLNLPKPAAFHIVYEEGKEPLLKKEQVDLLVDDNDWWIRVAESAGIPALHVRGTRRI